MLHQPFDVFLLNLRILMNQVHKLIVLILNLSELLEQLVFPLALGLQQHGHLLAAPSTFDQKLIIAMLQPQDLLLCRNQFHMQPVILLDYFPHLVSQGIV